MQILIVISVLIIIIVIYVFGKEVIKNMKPKYYSNVGVIDDLIKHREQLLDVITKTKYNNDRKFNIRNNKVYDEAMFINKDSVTIETPESETTDIENIDTDELLIETIVKSIVESLVKSIDESDETINSVLKKEEIKNDIESNLNDTEDYVEEYREPTIFPFTQINCYPQEYTECREQPLVIIPFSYENEVDKQL